MSLVLEVDGTRQIRERVREGTIATDLMKPISVPLFFFSDGIVDAVNATGAFLYMTDALLRGDAKGPFTDDRKSTGYEDQLLGEEDVQPVRPAVQATRG